MKVLLQLALVIVLFVSSSMVKGETIEFVIKSDIKFDRSTESILHQVFNDFFLSLKKIIPVDIYNNVSRYKTVINIVRDFPIEAAFILPYRLADKECYKNCDEEIHIRVKTSSLNSKNTMVLMAHEFLHGIHAIYNPQAPSWIKEGLAQMFEYFYSGHLNGLNFRAALDRPLTPLMGLYDPFNQDRAQYGHNMLYMYYLLNNCGGKKLFWDLVRSDQKGPLIIDQALLNAHVEHVYRQRPQCENFHESAIHFEVAKIHNRQQLYQIEDRSRFFLFSTTAKLSFPLYNNEQELLGQIKELPIYSSLKVAPKMFLKIKKKLNLSFYEIYFSQNISPFDVQKNIPPKLDHWDVIIIKIPSNESLVRIAPASASGMNIN